MGAAARSSQPVARRAARATPTASSGPSWLRLPMLVLGAFLLDILPRTLWQLARTPAACAAERRRERIARALDPRADHPGGDRAASASTSSTSATGTSSRSCRS